MIFLKTLMAEYLRQCGHVIPAKNGILDPDDMPSSDETADAFARFQNTAAPLRHSARKAYHFPGRRLPLGKLQGMRCKLSAQELKTAADHGKDQIHMVFAWLCFSINGKS